MIRRGTSTHRRFLLLCCRAQWRGKSAWELNILKAPEKAVKEKLLREQLTTLLSGGEAHLDWKAAFAEIPPKLRGIRPAAMPHSAWELLEHLRIAQWDILEFSRD